MAKDLQLNLNMNGKLDPSFSAATKGARDQLAGVEAKTKDVIRAANQQAAAKSWQAFSKSAGGARSAVAGVGRELIGVGKAAAGLVAGNGLLGASIYGVAKSSANYADAAIKNAQAAGMATDAFTEYAYAADMSGVSNQEFVSSTARLNKTFIDALAGNDKAVDAFTRAGVGLRDSAGNMKTTEQLYDDLADSFSKIPEGAWKSALAMEFFGKSGTKMLPFLNAGREGINAMREDAIRLGISLTDAEAKNAEAFNDSFANIGKAMLGASLTIGKELWPTLTKVHVFISDKLVETSKELAVAIKSWDVAAWWDATEPELNAAWTSFKEGIKGVNDFAQSLGGWIPIAKTGLQIWLAWRGVRLAKSFWDAGKAVKAMSGDFLNLQYAGVSVRGALQGIGPALKGFVINNSASVFGQRWTGTFGLIGDAAKDGMRHTGAFAKALGGKFLSTVLFLPKAFLAASGAALKFGAALLLNPVGIAIAAIAGLGYAIYKCVKHWDSITAAAGKVWSVVKGVFAVGWSMLPGWVQKPLEKVAGFVGAIGAKIWSGITKDWGRIKAIFGPVFSSIGKIFSGAWTWFSNIVGSALDGISKALGFSGEGWGKTVSAAWASVKGFFAKGWDAIWGVFSEKFTTIGTAFEDSFIGGLMETVKQFNPLILIKDAFNAVSRWIFDFDIAAAGAAFAKNLGDGILKAWDGIKDSVKSAVLGWIPGGESIVNAAGAAKDAVSGAYNSATGALSRWWNGDNAATATAAAQAIPAMANGGIVTRPQLTLIGEAGPEVVIPVTRAARARELMGKAAEMMGAGGQGTAHMAAPFGSGMMRGAAAAGLSALLSIAPAAAVPSAMPDVNVLNSVPAPAVRMLGGTRGGDSVANYGGDVASPVGGSSNVNNRLSLINNAFAVSSNISSRFGDTISSLAKGGSNSAVYGGSSTAYGGSSSVVNNAAPHLGDTLTTILPAISNIFSGDQMATANTANFITRMGDSASSIMSAFAGGDVSSVANSFSTVGGDVLRNIISTVTNAGQGLDKTVIQSLPAFANGGFVDSPQLALVGEAGPEMIVPLGRENRARDLMGAAAEFMGWSGEESRGGGDTFHVTFAPTIHLDGGDGGVRGQVRQAVRESHHDFERMFEEFLTKRERRQTRTGNF